MLQDKESLAAGVIIMGIAMKALTPIIDLQAIKGCFLKLNGIINCSLL